MIKANMGTVEVLGLKPVLAAELEMIVEAFRKEDTFSEEYILEIVKNGFESAKNPKEEAEEPSESELNEALDVLRKFLEKKVG